MLPSNRAPLHALLVEDCDADAFLLLRELGQAYDVSHLRVETGQALTAALESRPWDVVIADYSMPVFGALEALELVRRFDPDVPFLLVSGTISEDVAVGAMRAGAQDCLLKGNLARLVPAIKRELREAANRRSKREVERALQESREGFQLLVEGIRDYAIFMLDIGGCITTWNAGAQRMTGCPAAEAVGKGFSWLYREKEATLGKPQEAIRRALRDGTFAGRSWWVRKNAEPFLADLLLTRLETAEGSARGISVVMRDITDRVRAEQRNEIGHEVTRILSTAGTFAEAAPEIARTLVEGLDWRAALLWSVDNEAGHLRLAGSWGKGVQAALETEPAPGRKTYAPGVGLPGRVWTAGMARWETAAQRLGLQPGTPSGADGAFAFPIRSLGRLLHVFEFRIEEFQEPGSDLLRLIESVGRQIGQYLERRHAEDLLRARTEQLRANTEAMASFLESGDWKKANEVLLAAAMRLTGSCAGFIGSLVDGPILRIAAQQDLLGYLVPESNEQALRRYNGRGPIDFRDMDSLFGRAATVGRPVLSNDPDASALPGKRLPGNPELVSFLSVPISQGGETLGVIAAANRPGGYSDSDVEKLEVLARTASVLFDSFRRRERESSLETQLRQAQKMEAVGRLAGGIAHDFNNLLTVILGHAEIVLEKHQVELRTRRDVEAIRKSADRAASLTKQLLAFSRKQVMQPRVVDVNAAVSELTLMLKRLLGETIDLELRQAPELGRVLVDPGQIDQVLMNLAVNARDAMPGGGRLTIETANVELDAEQARTLPGAKSGSYVTISVTDTGSGMEPQVMTRIFEPFFTTKEQGKGTGLGLATVYGIVKQSGGYIYVDSGVGLGSCFKVYLPNVGQKPVSESRKAPDARSSMRPAVVLLVEDHEEVRQIARDVLGRAGYTVLEAAAGSEAFALAARRRGPIDLLLTDVVMPDMSGPALALKLAPLYPRLKVLFMSGYNDDELECVLPPDTQFLEKPFVPASLLAKIAACLDAEKEQLEPMASAS